MECVGHHGPAILALCSAPPQGPRRDASPPAFADRVPVPCAGRRQRALGRDRRGPRGMQGLGRRRLRARQRRLQDGRILPGARAPLFLSDTWSPRRAEHGALTPTPRALPAPLCKGAPPRGGGGRPGGSADPREGGDGHQPADGVRDTPPLGGRGGGGEGGGRAPRAGRGAGRAGEINRNRPLCPVALAWAAAKGEAPARSVFIVAEGRARVPHCIRPQDCDGLTPLLLAVATGQCACAERLVVRISRSLLPGTSAPTCKIAAMTRAFLATLQAAGAQVTAALPGRMTTLHIACDMGSTRAVKAIVGTPAGKCVASFAQLAERRCLCRALTPRFCETDLSASISVSSPSDFFPSQGAVKGEERGRPHAAMHGGGERGRCGSRNP